MNQFLRNVANFLRMLHVSPWKLVICSFFGILEDLGVAIQNDNGINNFFDPYEQQISNTNNANF